MALLDPELQQDRLYSKNALSWRLVTTPAGYFVYDLYVHSARFEFLPALVHAGAALTVFLSGIYCGILHYYGAHTLLASRQLLTGNIRASEELPCWVLLCHVLYRLWCVGYYVRLELSRRPQACTKPGGLSCRNPLAAASCRQGLAAGGRDTDAYADACAAALDPVHCMLQVACSCCGSAARPLYLCAGGSMHWGVLTPSCTCTTASP